MIKRSPLYVGIDLGTSNSAVSIFDGSTLTMVPNPQGNELTPSLVSLDAHGSNQVGEWAKQHVMDPKHRVHREFKRLMGSHEQSELLAMELLRCLREDILRQYSIEVDRAVIAVPALFELPQANATRQAALRAGFREVALIQEPVAAALAAGWGAAQSDGNWLVYDMGGGTFDVSLLTTSDGYFHVLAHDGDNFLGGRDMDWALVEWFADQFAKHKNIHLSRANPEQTGLLQKLKQLAEVAKIELSQCSITTLTFDSLSIPVKQADLHRSCRPIIERSIAVCQRLLQTNHMSSQEIHHIVFVGGPTLMPFLREQVSQALGIPIKADEHSLAPMTLVAKGAALYAANIGLDAWHEAKNRELPPSAHGLWLRYPPVSTELEPYVIGRLINPRRSSAPVQIRLHRHDELWASPWTSLNHESSFIITANLIPQIENQFTIEARDSAGQSVGVEPDHLRIIQGLTFADPPLPRSIGVALANDRVHKYFERGEPLPARRTFRHTTIETVLQGSSDSLLHIPIVQGESTYAHRCQLVGSLTITGEQIHNSVSAGTEIEITLELDRGGALSAQAWIPAIRQRFSQLSHLLVSAASVESLQKSFANLEVRLHALRAKAFRSRASHLLESLTKIEPLWTAAAVEMAAAHGEDVDAKLKVNRILLEFEEKLEECESQLQWPELMEEEQWKIAWASRWLEKYGTVQERRLFAEIAESLSQAKTTKNSLEFEQKICLAYELGFSAFLRDPAAWPALFEDAAANMDQTCDLPKAYLLVQEGRTAMKQKNLTLLERVVRGLWDLLPPQNQQRKQAFSSSLR